MICDFCSSPDPKWDYDAEDFTVSLPNGWRWISHDGWVACKECSAVIEKNEAPIDWGFCAKRLEVLHGEKSLDAWDKVRSAQYGFLEHRMAPRRLLSDEET